MVATLNLIGFCKNFYARNGLIVDKEIRQSFVRRIPERLKQITREQQLFARELTRLIDVRESEGWEKLEKNSSLFVKLSTKTKKGELCSWGKAVSFIDASAENVLAWLWDIMSNERLGAIGADKISREVIAIIAPNQNVLATNLKFPWPYSSRRLIFESVWTKRNDGW